MHLRKSFVWEQHRPPYVFIHCVSRNNCMIEKLKTLIEKKNNNTIKYFNMIS